MSQMCDDPNITVADMRARMFRGIEQFGWMVQHVAGEPFAYTIGLTCKGSAGVDGRGARTRSVRLTPQPCCPRDGAPGDRCMRPAHRPDGRQYLLGQVDTRGLYGAIEAYGDDVEALHLTPMRWTLPRIRAASRQRRAAG